MHFNIFAKLLNVIVQRLILRYLEESLEQRRSIQRADRHEQFSKERTHLGRSLKGRVLGEQLNVLAIVDCKAFLDCSFVKSGAESTID